MDKDIYIYIYRYRYIYIYIERERERERERDYLIIYNNIYLLIYFRICAQYIFTIYIVLLYI